jgi:hypothetical protein
MRSSKGESQLYTNCGAKRSKHKEVSWTSSPDNNNNKTAPLLLFVLKGTLIAKPLPKKKKKDSQPLKAKLLQSS